MKALKIAALVVLVYAGIVVAFESLIGFFQPTAGSTLVLTTFEEDGTAHDRVLSPFESDGRLYVAVNHWPRAWYGRTLQNPEVRVTREGDPADHRAVPVSGAEHERIAAEYALPLAIRIVTGFPPRHFVRLDPR
jgi:hypothetical protein